MPNPAIYARMSTVLQKATSIEDQVRKCQALAGKEGVIVEQPWIFSDEAVSGTKKGDSKRHGFQRLIDAWESGLIDMVFADEVCRFTRDNLQGAQLMERIKNTGVIVITADGIDTRTKNWEALWCMKMIFAVSEVSTTAERVQRGMEGQLIRGFMIAMPPFGYKPVRTLASESDSIHDGTCWEIHPESAAILKEMYGMRAGGMSVAKIARVLNDRGIPSSRKCRANKANYWRPASVYRVLKNTIYRGVFRLHGSDQLRNAARRKRQVNVITEFLRPELRLVSDELWYACNPTNREARIRGGGKYVFSGLLQCGDCGASVSVGGGPKSFSLHCPQCEQAVRVGGQTNFIGYTSVSAARHALLHALKILFTGPVFEEFRQRLRARLVEEPNVERDGLRVKLDLLIGSRDRLLRLALNPDIGEDFLAESMATVAAQIGTTETQVRRLSGKPRLSARVVEDQLGIDPLSHLEHLLSEGCELEAYKIRATLRRLVPKFRFVEKPAAYHAIFELEFSPGALVAELSETEPVDETPVRLRVVVKSSARRPPIYDVDVERIT